MLSGSSRGGRAGPRIRPPRRAIVGEEAEFDSLWGTLRESFCDIHKRNASRLAFEALYRASYKIVLKKKGPQLYEKVKAFETEWFSEQVMPVILALLNAKVVNIALRQIDDVGVTERRELGEKFLRGLKDSWEDHRQAMNMMTDILMYMDRIMVTDGGQPSIFATTTGLFRDEVLEYTLHDFGTNSTLFDMLNAVILDLINMERDGDTVDRSLVRSCTHMLEGLYKTNAELDNERLYLTNFQPELLKSSRVYYQNECEKLLQGQDAGVWLRDASRRLEEERDRCLTTLSIASSDGLKLVVQEELVSKHLRDFLNLPSTGLRAMLDNDRREELHMLFRLVESVDNQFNSLKDSIAKHIVDSGVEIEKNVNSMDFSSLQPEADEEGDRPKQPLTAAAQATLSAIRWVQDVLELKAKFDSIHKECFESNKVLGSAITKAYSDFINLFTRASEFISLYIDDTLKKGGKGREEAEVDVVLEKAIVLIQHIQDRDMFERYYQKHLAKRLLHGRSESIESETQMINRMKQSVGNHFTQRFEGMFKDMKISEDLRTDYKSYIQGLGDTTSEDTDAYKRIDLSINVLTSNNWPPDVMGRSSNPDENMKLQCIYPPDIKKLQESFKKFYIRNRTGRVLTWVGSAGTAEIKCTFPKVKDSGPTGKERRYDLTVTTYGMVVVMLFNDVGDDEWLSFEEIQNRTKIPADDLRRAMASISIPPKSRILLKEPMNKVVKSSDKFAFNKGFVSKTIKVRAPINVGSKAESKEERKKTVDKNDETRRHACSACIVRIMKQRKQLSHNELMREVIEQLAARFRPDIPIIKSQIEDLINKEYLERTEVNDQSGYIYLA